MKSKRLIGLLISGVLVAVGGLALGASASGSGSNALVGTWLVRITPASVGTPQFDEMMTFSPGGGIVESNNYPFFTLGLATPGPGQGAWTYRGSQTFEFTFVKFLYAPNGAAAGTLKVVGSIDHSKDNDTWTGPAAVFICNNQVEGCFQIDTTNGTATRMSAGS